MQPGAKKVHAYVNENLTQVNENISISLTYSFDLFNINCHIEK